MHKTYLHTVRRRSVRFLKWSRKKYAAFCSLHCQVTIGQVGKGIADASLSKRTQTIKGACVEGCNLLAASDEKDDGWEVPDWLEDWESRYEWMIGRECVSFSVAGDVSKQLDSFFIDSLPCLRQMERGICAGCKSALQEQEFIQHKCFFLF